MRDNFLIKLLIEICIETINQIFSINVLFGNIFIVSNTTKNNFTSSRWNSTGFLWEKGIPVKCHENVMNFQCHSMALKMLVHFDGIFMENVHGIVMEFEVIFDQNSDGNQ